MPKVYRAEPSSWRGPMGTWTEGTTFRVNGAADWEAARPEKDNKAAARSKYFIFMLRIHLMMRKAASLFPIAEIIS
jgi:hypothetical protein